MFSPPAAAPAVTARISHTAVLMVTLPFGAEPLTGCILPYKPCHNHFLLAAYLAMVMIGNWTTEHRRKTLQRSAILVTQPDRDLY